MRTKYFSNTDTETLEDLKIRVDAWITSHKITQVVEMKTSSVSKNVPPVFFIKMSYNDKTPPKAQSNPAAPIAKRRS